MRTSLAVLFAVVAVGYSMYGGLFVVSTQLAHSLGDDAGAAGKNDFVDAPGVSEGLTGPFEFSAVDAGLDYSFVSDASGDMAKITDAGVYAGDYDRDGWTDLLAVGGDQPVLFENNEGTFRRSGALPTVERDLWGATWVDYNVDSAPDIVLLAEDAPPLLLENVDGRFERREAFEQPLDVGFGATVADYNRDGCPDLFAYQYGNWTERAPRGIVNYSVPVNGDNGNPDVLYRGTCSGFESVDDAGLKGARWTLAASFVDFNDDGYPDIHQANDINNDVLYLNQRDGTFKQIALAERTNRNAMSSEIADITRDGRLDVFVTNIYYPEWAARKIKPEVQQKARGNNLLSNHGDGLFVQRGEQYGINTGGWGWAAAIADLDNDGDQDLFHSTRHMTFERRDLTFSRTEQKRLSSRSFYSYPAVWERQNLTAFRRVSPNQSGFRPANGRGVASLDYDRDGDLDLVVATTGEYQVYENRIESGRALQVRVLGPNGSQSRAYGATVWVNSTETSQHRRVQSRTDFLSQDARVLHFGVGNASRVDVRVRWPDGSERVFEGVTPDRRLVVTPAGIERRGEFSR